MAKEQFGFIGTGNMGGALATAVARAVAPSKMVLADRDSDKATALAQQLGCHTANVIDVAATSKFVVLGVKPQVLPELAATITPSLKENNGVVLISMAAGITIAQIRTWFGDFPVIRIMPNTAVAIGSGVVQYAAHPDVTQDALDAFEAAFSDVGVLDTLPETLMDAACALSGSGPAFAYAFLESLADGGVACGLPREKAQRYAAAMVRGAANMVLNGAHPAALKDAVCSPGGTTITGMRALEKGGMRSAVMEAVIAAYEHAKGTNE